MSINIEKLSNDISEFKVLKTQSEQRLRNLSYPKDENEINSLRFSIGLYSFKISELEKMLGEK